MNRIMRQLHQINPNQIKVLVREINVFNLIFKSSCIIWTNVGQKALQFEGLTFTSHHITAWFKVMIVNMFYRFFETFSKAWFSSPRCSRGLQVKSLPPLLSLFVIIVYTVYCLTIFWPCTNFTLDGHKIIQHFQQ